MTPRIALASLVMLLTWLLSGLFIFDISLHALLLTALAALALLGRALSFEYRIQPQTKFYLCDQMLGIQC
jgi:4-amino-4-deoxy-L-arabinose transferase-like glycosyltransferase